MVQYCTDAIDRKVAKRVTALKGDTLEIALRQIEATMFFRLPSILFPLRAMNVPEGSHKRYQSEYQAQEQGKNIVRTDR